MVNRATKLAPAAFIPRATPRPGTDRDLRHFLDNDPQNPGRNTGRLSCTGEYPKMHGRAPPQPGAAPLRRRRPGARNGQGSRPPARLGIPGGPEAEGVSGYTCRAAANSRPRNRRDLVSEAGKTVTRSLTPRSVPLALPSSPSPSVLLKQRPSTPTAIFSLPQKPPLRQTPVSSFSAMPPASARWEMKAGESWRHPGSRFARPVCPENYNSQHAPQLTPPFSGPLIGAEGDPVDGRGRSKRQLKPSDWRRLGIFVSPLRLRLAGGAKSTDFFF